MEYFGQNEVEVDTGTFHFMANGYINYLAFFYCDLFICLVVKMTVKAKARINFIQAYT